MTGRHLPAPPLPAGRPRLVVTGFMGTGKTSAGREAAARLALPFLDLDVAVARRAGSSIPELFAARGEEGFRALERAAVADAARLSACVVATGGGAPMDAPSFTLLAAGSSVAVLTGSPEELARRLSENGGRPLLDGGDPARIAALLNERREAYAAAGRPLDTAGRTPEEVGDALADRYRAAAVGDGVRIPVAGPDGQYPVVLRQGGLAEAGPEVRAALPHAVLAVLVADAAVDGSLGEQVAGSLMAAGLRVERVVLPPGEAAKTLDVVAALWSRFVQLGVDRTSVVVALGGGAVLDAAGFAAATFARGVPLVNVPTTLLAMADAGVGGKTAIDHGGAKNSVGAFHHPRIVLADPAALASLPIRDLRAGLAEVVKMAVTASPLILDVLEAMPEGAGGAPADLAWIVEQAVRMKAAYVAEDPADAGVRHTLNVGHTIAHGLEAASDFGLAHGEAVAIGLVAESRFGEARGITPPGTAVRLEALLARLHLPVTPPPGLHGAAIAAAMGSDKKRRAGRAVVVVPAPGGAELVEGVDPAELLTFLYAEVRS